MTLNQFKEVFFFFNTICHKQALPGFGTVAFQRFIILARTFYAMSRFITQCSLPDLTGLFSSPIQCFILFVFIPKSQAHLI